ncbi:CysG [Desulfamplus magnetovallimortis]|uniref:precorrin-2 dehydrogenase n=1 Tax=Desulfamplus magnetovallimortis TaxID=1246637 RepID=A0A1W1HI70_9BACT|nr:bifunctional precorrin-2 dehydrogenase/sirohydrochlorin ferrochelatase [Desulfamplus magnetovallimortis]SLM32207.1 CysG [Desulfamplus magnetovallimortis]
MKYYPVLLDINMKNCLVVGGGKVGARKAATLAEAGGVVTVVSPDFSNSFYRHPLNSYGNIKKIERSYQTSDLDTMFLVICATNHESTNIKVTADANTKGILCNIADNPESSHFILPAIINRGDLMITVSTSGSSPAFAKKIKNELEQKFGKEYEFFLDLMGLIRKRLLNFSKTKEGMQSELTQKQHAAIFRKLVNSDILNRIAENDESAVYTILKEILNGFPEEIYLNPDSGNIFSFSEDCS